MSRQTRQLKPAALTLLACLLVFMSFFVMGAGQQDKDRTGSTFGSRPNSNANKKPPKPKEDRVPKAAPSPDGDKQKERP